MPTMQTKQLFPQIVLGFLTPPTMFLFMAEKTAVEFLENIGESTEEIFRGERLPILHQHKPVNLHLSEN